MSSFGPTDDDPSCCEWLKSEAIVVLSQAAQLLKNSEMTESLTSHGWSRDFARSLGQECGRLQARAEADDLKAPRGVDDFGLGRWMLDMVSPLEKDRDALSDSVWRASLAPAGLRRGVSQVPVMDWVHLPNPGRGRSSLWTVHARNDTIGRSRVSFGSLG